MQKTRINNNKQANALRYADFSLATFVMQSVTGRDSVQEFIENIPFFLQNDVDAIERDVSPEEVMQWCQEQNITSFIETSAKTSTNVSAAFTLAVAQWQKFERKAESNMRAQGTIDLSKSVNLNASKSSCCSSGSSPRQRNIQHETLQ